MDRSLTAGPSFGSPAQLAAERRDPEALQTLSGHLVRGAHSDDADHRFRQADRRFQAMPITLEERRSIGALGVGVEG